MLCNPCRENSHEMGPRVAPHETPSGCSLNELNSILGVVAFVVGFALWILMDSASMSIAGPLVIE